MSKFRHANGTKRSIDSPPLGLRSLSSFHAVSRVIRPYPTPILKKCLHSTTSDSPGLQDASTLVRSRSGLRVSGCHSNSSDVALASSRDLTPLHGQSDPVRPDFQKYLHSTTSDSPELQDASTSVASRSALCVSVVQFPFLRRRSRLFTVSHAITRPIRLNPTRFSKNVCV